MEGVKSLIFDHFLFCFFQNQSMIGQQIRPITPNQPYTSMQTSQVSLFLCFSNKYTSNKSLIWLLLSLGFNYQSCLMSHCSEHISGLYLVRITHGDAAASIPGWWYRSFLLWEPKLPGRPSWSQPGCGGSS